MLIILQLLPESDRIQAMNADARLLLRLSHDAKDVQTLLMLIPKEYRLREVQNNKRGYQSFLSAIWDNYAALKATVSALSDNENVWKAYQTLACNAPSRSWRDDRRSELSKLEIEQLKCIADHGRRPEITIIRKEPTFFNSYDHSKWLRAIDEFQLTPKELSLLAIVFLGVHGIEHHGPNPEELDLQAMMIICNL